MHYASRKDVSGYTLTDEYAIYFGSKAIEKEYSRILKTEVTFGYCIVGAWAFAPRPNQWSKFQDFFLAKSSDKTYHPYVDQTPVHTGKANVYFLIK